MDQSLIDQSLHQGSSDPTKGASGKSAPHAGIIGVMREVGSNTSTVRFDAGSIRALTTHSDPTIAMTGQVGSHVKVRVGNRWLLCNIRDIRLDDDDDSSIIGAVNFLGEGREQDGRFVKFNRGVTGYPAPGDPVYPVTHQDLAGVFSAQDRPHIEVGTVYPTEDVRAALFIDALLGKHFALLGSTGTGKSTATALILHRIVEKAPEAHVIMLDPHGEYPAAFPSNGMIFNTDNLAVPHWLMNFEEHCEVFVTAEGPTREMEIDILAKCLLAARSKSRITQTLGKITVDSPVPYVLSDLLGTLTAQMGKLEKANELAPYMRLKTKIEELKNDPRYGFLFSGLMVSDNMGRFLAKILRLPADGRPISIIDLSAVPSDIISVVVAMLSRLIFDYALWSRDEQRRPILLVCEEAHRYVPSDRSNEGASVRKRIERIAKEGRKYGVSLGLITQRPSDLTEGVLSQCGTIVSMRLNNDRDQAYVRNAMPEGSHRFLDAIPALRNRECIVCGEGVAVPIRIRLDDLAPEHRPASEDPIFSELWTQTGDEEASLDRIIYRWRNQS